MTIIPKIKSPTSGLKLTRSGWAAEYTTGGKRRYKSLATRNKKDAIATRDAFYAALVAGGAVTAGDPCLVAARQGRTRPTDSKRYIHKLKAPYRVTIYGRTIGHYATRKAAVAARNAHLGLKP